MPYFFGTSNCTVIECRLDAAVVRDAHALSDRGRAPRPLPASLRPWDSGDGLRLREGAARAAPSAWR